jgi:hypothetical protein
MVKMDDQLLQKSVGGDCLSAVGTQLAGLISLGGGVASWNPWMIGIGILVIYTNTGNMLKECDLLC